MKTENTVTGGMCLIVIIIFSLIYIPICFWTDRNLDFYISQIKGVPVDIPFWVSMVVSLFEPVAVINLIGELIRLVAF